MRGWSLLLFGLSGCGAEPPIVSLDLIETPGQPTVASVGRLNLAIHTAGVKSPLIDINVMAGSGTNFEGALEPGSLFYAWVRGYVACTGPCVAEANAVDGDCVCVGGGPAGEILRIEGCTPWECVLENTRFRVTLGPPTPLCPPFPAPEQCPAAR